jgi:sulfur-oxidizing protein SoxY
MSFQNENTARWSRRSVLGGLAATLTLMAVPVRADDALVAEAVKTLFGDRPRQDGRIKVTLPPLAETGNTVPISVEVDSPLTETDFVKQVAIISTKNPRAMVATMMFGPKAAKPVFSTNMRLNGTQDVIVMAEMSDGTIWQTQTRVKVTVGACDTLQLRY